MADKAQFFKALDLLNESIYIVDPDNFELSYGNDAFVESFGEDVIGMPCYEAIYGDDVPCFGCPAKALMNGENPGFNKVLGANGSVNLCGASSLTIEDHDFIMVSKVEISDFEKKEEAEKEQYMDALLSGAKHSYMVDVTEGIIYVEPEYKDDELLEKMDFEYPVDYDKFVDTWEKKAKLRYLNEGDKQRIHSEGLFNAFKSGTRQLEIQYQIGAKKQFRKNTILLSKRKGDGHVLANVVVYDITEAMKAKKESTENSEITQAIANLYSVVYKINIGADSIEEIRVSDDFKKIFKCGKCASDTLEQWITDGSLEDDLEKNRTLFRISAIKRTLRMQKVASFEIPMKEVGWVEILLVALKKNMARELTEMLWLVRSVDARKRAELVAQEELRIAHKNAEHDALTGLYNRHGFNRRIDELFKNPRPVECASIMMDIDNFKRVNDTYGHDAGDEVLRRLGRIVEKNMDGKGLYCRWGGEEFNIFINTGYDAVEIAESIRKDMEAQVISYETFDINVTLSLGVCVASDMTQVSIADLTNIADKCLYESKNTGKNRVTLSKI